MIGGRQHQDVIYTSTKAPAVKEQLNQLDVLFQIIESIRKKMIILDPNYSDDDWFDQLDEKVFSVKLFYILQLVERSREGIRSNCNCFKK